MHIYLYKHVHGIHIKRRTKIKIKRGWQNTSKPTQHLIRKSNIERFQNEKPRDFLSDCVHNLRRPCVENI